MTIARGPDEFAYIDRYREASQNRIHILTDRLVRPQQLSATAAKLACAYVLDVAIAPAQGFGDSIVPGNWSDLTNPLVLRQPNQFPVSVDVKESENGEATFTVEALMAGRGAFTCNITNTGGGIWRTDLKGDIPEVPSRMGLDADITKGGTYKLSSFSVLGPYMPWTWMTGNELRLSSKDDLFAQVPHDLQRTEGPSFNCDGLLDPAAEIICSFPLLAQADATMVAIYRDRRDEGTSGLLEAQRTWIKRRDALCRPQWTNKSNPTELTLTGYCLLESTMEQIGILLRL